MQIERAIDESTWWAVARACAHATFFHTPLWGRIAVAGGGAIRSHALGATLDDGTEVVLPLADHGNGRWFSTFAGCYGGPIASGPLPGAAEEEIYRALLASGPRVLGMTGNPLREEEGVDLSVVAARPRDDFTHILRLDRDLDRILAGFSKGHRSGAKKGRRKGVTVRAASESADWREYYRAYEDSLRRWGDQATSRYPWKMFDALSGLAREFPDQIRLWVAEVDQRVIAGALVFYWNEHADWWHGASFEEFFDYSPNNVLQEEIIGDAVARGFRYYDFNPSGGHDGVARFKDHFGAERWPIRRWRVARSRSPVLERLRRVLRPGS